MGESRQVVLLTGASGSMGFETFKQLWERRGQHDLVLLLRPSSKNKKLFRSYEKEAGVKPFDGRGIARGEGLKIVWGDALEKEDVTEACKGIDWCLHTMALISPEADRKPELAEKINFEATRNIVEAIEAQDPENIRMVHIGSVAQYGDRLPPVHMGRTGDPILPSLYDYYALTKIRAELAVMQSRIRHRVSLRQTFIMIPELFSLMDPIMFHQPINSFMENITARDSGRLMVNCLEVADDSDFWGNYYNISGGPECRTTFFELLEKVYGMLGLQPARVMERNWFALKNFHMLYYEDAEKLDQYLHHWDGVQSQEDYYRVVWEKMPWYLKMTAWCCKHLPPYRWMVERITHSQLSKLSQQPDGTRYWVAHNDSGKINAFYGSLEAFQAIPGWGDRMPSLDQQQPAMRLTHGYDEDKETLDLEDLQTAAGFRGGVLKSDSWGGDVHTPLAWTCCQEHTFEMTPHAVLKGGHWCVDCIGPPWNYQALVEDNPFAAQVLDP